MALRPAGAALMQLSMPPVLTCLTQPLCCAVSLLDLEPEGILEHVARHLPCIAVQRLRSTCRVLKRSRSLLGAMTKVWTSKGSFRPAVDVPFLLKFHGLQKLGVSHPTSVFSLHQLSILSSLRELKIDAHCVHLDLSPLGSLTQLRSLTLHSTATDPSVSMLNLEELTQISMLQLGEHVPYIPTLGQLTGMQTLSLCGCANLTHLSTLSQLTSVHFGRKVMDGEGVEVALWYLRQLTALRVLLADTRQPLPQLNLTQLTGLHLILTGPSRPLDLTELPRLARLAVVKATPWSFAITSPSVSSLQLMPCNPAGPIPTRLPDLEACTSLQHLRLIAGDCDVTVDTRQLPAQRVHISALVKGGQVFAQCGRNALKQFELAFYDQHMLAEWAARVPKLELWNGNLWVV